MSEDAYVPYYDDFQKQWNVKEVASGVCYPMTGANMASELSLLLNTYVTDLKAVHKELYSKDRKFEELGYDLDELDEELGIRA